MKTFVVFPLQIANYPVSIIEVPSRNNVFLPTPHIARNASYVGGTDRGDCPLYAVNCIVYIDTNHC
jgi:hypothetical protein